MAPPQIAREQFGVDCQQTEQKSNLFTRNGQFSHAATTRECNCQSLESIKMVDNDRNRSDIRWCR